MFKQHQTGLTLVETLLVLVVGAIFFTIGLRIYNQLSTQADALRLRANAQQILTAMKYYYQANCRKPLDASGAAMGLGKLDPSEIGSATTLTLTLGSGTTSSGTDLIKSNMLNSTNWRPINPLVDNTASPDQGYFAQFNRLQTSNADPQMSIYACAGDINSNADAKKASFTPACTNINASSYKTLSSTNAPSLDSTVIFWIAQVKIKLADCNKAAAVFGTTGASCVTANATDSCSNGAIPVSSLTATCSNRYLIFEQPAAMITPNTSSPLWISQPLVKQFNMQYTNDGMATYSGVQSSTSWYNTQNYLCGG